jgi:hypothetical protein
MHTSYTVLGGKPDGYVLLRRPRCMRDDNVRTDHGNGVVSCALDSSGSEQGPVAGSCEYGNEPSGCIKGGEFLD